MKKEQKTNKYPSWYNQQMYNMYLYYSWYNQQMYNMQQKQRYDKLEECKPDYNIKLKDYGPESFVVDIGKAAKQNETFRTALWTGENLQVTLMSIAIGDDIGLEVHRDGDQFISIEEGQGVVKMGDSKDNLDFKRKIHNNSVIMIPAGKWHNIINTGNQPLKLYAIYAPPEHPQNTVHETKADA